MVLTFTDSYARLLRVEYKVVVFSDPVGPVTSTMPWERNVMVAGGCSLGLPGPAG